MQPDCPAYGPCAVPPDLQALHDAVVLLGFLGTLSCVLLLAGALLLWRRRP